VTTSFVVFDWDGTLADSKATIVECLRDTLTAMRLPAGDDQALARVIGLSLDDVGRALIPGATAHQVETFTQTYRDTWLAPGPRETNLFAGVHETLAAIAERGIPMAVATGKNRAGLDRELGNTGLGPRFVATRTADETRSKPDPQMLHELLAEVGVPAHETVFVGDSHWDLQMAAAADVRAIAVSYGAQAIDELLQHDPWRHVDAIGDILPLIS
jgi:phosphoglycolate phosphatase